ncbi:Nucleoporin NDC1 [Lunasporangiospora selenospora]|uniref:Nucleoporin NDC1 n=1 Tax=Lunasporangiospora selenospora TaxID=979761 RepID=A0A9P6FWR9_9FUNG|nr:Nucleoporin NDC1 [Lunasporangiospora selenospora]
MLISFYVIAASVLHGLIILPSSTGAANYNTLVVYISKIGTKQINERYILMRTFSVALGVGYGMLHLLQQKDRLYFSTVQLNTVEYIYGNFQKKALTKAWSFSWRMATYFWIVYNILLSRPLVNMAMRFVSEDIRYHAPQYGPRWYSVGLAIELLLASVSISIFFETLHLLCDRILTKTMNATTSSIDPNACQVSGLKLGGGSGPNALLTYHAFQELNHLAGTAKARRVEIYTDASSSPSAWKQISAPCLDVLTKATDRINKSIKAGKPAAPALVSSTLGTSSLNSSFRRRLPPGQGGAFESNIFRPSKKDTFFDSLKGPSTEELLAKAKIEADKDSTKRPNLTGSRDRPEVVAFRWLHDKIKELVLKRPEIQKIFNKIPNADLLHSTEDYMLIVWSAQSLSRLVQASYSEDQFGIVQTDITKVLEALLGLLIAFESLLLKESGSKQLEPSPISAIVGAQELVIDRPQILVRALKPCIYQVINTFKGQMEEFAVAPAYSERLRQFVQFDD